MVTLNLFNEIWFRWISRCHGFWKDNMNEKAPFLLHVLDTTTWACGFQLACFVVASCGILFCVAVLLFYCIVLAMGTLLLGASQLLCSVCLLVMYRSPLEKCRKHMLCKYRLFMYILSFQNALHSLSHVAKLQDKSFQNEDTDDLLFVWYQLYFGDIIGSQKWFCCLTRSQRGQQCYLILNQLLSVKLNLQCHTLGIVFQDKAVPSCSACIDSCGWTLEKFIALTWFSLELDFQTHTENSSKHYCTALSQLECGSTAVYNWKKNCCQKEQLTAGLIGGNELCSWEMNDWVLFWCLYIFSSCLYSWSVHVCTVHCKK